MGWNDTFVVLPIAWNSKGIPLSEWLSLLTLSLAPLIVHIVAGAPRPSYLCHSRPRWHDLICHFNPTSILWRYAAITDRRIFSNNWSVMDTAAANAIFWTTAGWDGSEEMVERSIPHVMRWPDKPRVALFSVEMAKTVITVLQGIQALAALLGIYVDGEYTSIDALNGLFIPIALCGLLRLFPASWLTDDFYFAASKNDRAQTYPGHWKTTSPFFSKGDNMWDSVDNLIQYSETALPSPISVMARPVPSRMQLWLSRVFKVCYITPFLCAWALAFMFITPWVSSVNTRGVWTTTSYMMGIFYMVVLTPTILVYVYYWSKGATMTTIIPCISALWYKAYSISIIVFIFFLICVSSVETRKTPCGKYTAMPEQYGNPCATKMTQAVHVGQASGFTFGLAQNLTTTGQFSVTNFTGICMGSLDSAGDVREAIMLSQIVT